MGDFMAAACAEALAGVTSGDGGPFGAVVVKDGQVVGAGHNMVIGSNDSTAHGEIVAIRRAEQALGTYDLSGCELYTTGYPCPMCLAAILWARIDKVYYGCTVEDAARIGFDDSAFYEALAAPDYKGLLQLRQKDRQACLELFDKWLTSENKKLY